MSVQHVMFRCDASNQVGMGHIVRCICLAKAFTNAGHKVTFAINNHPLAIQALEGLDFAIMLVEQEYTLWCQHVIEQRCPDIFIGDIRDGLPIAAIEMMKRANILTVAIDEPSDYRIGCDLLFYPPSPLVEQLDWQGFSGQRFSGWEYLLLREEFFVSVEKKQHSATNVLVMMGGTDPNQLTLAVIAHLRLLDADLDLHVVIKDTHPDLTQIKQLQIPLARLTLHSNVTNMAKLMAQMDFAVVTFGMSAYELAALKVPAIHVCTEFDHHIASQSFVNEGIAQSVAMNELENICLFESKGISISNGVDNIVAKILETRYSPRGLPK